jgi:hypothetical protein
VAVATRKREHAVAAEIERLAAAILRRPAA